MKYAEVAENVRQLLANRPSQDEFIYELLLAYGKPKASITRLKQGTYNQSKIPGEVLWKKELYFKAVGLTTEGTKDHRGKASCTSVSSSEAGGEENILYAEIEELKKAKGTKAYNPRFLFVTDFEQILAVDRKTNDTLDIKFQGLETNFDFFLPWAGMEKTKLSNENPADVKAAEKMAKLFDAIKLDNPQYLREDAHAMNVFLGRLEVGEYFILRGLMVYVADMGEKEKKNTKVNARLRCIFENGTEGDLLLRSLARNLYKDGRRITEDTERLMDDLKDITADDAQTGYIYVLRSLSTNPEVAAIKDLYKIGFSSGAVEDRIKNAESQPTYLMAKVHLVEIFECYNLNPQKLENLLHTFFGKACLNVDVFDKNGKRCTPREWFIAPLPVIEEAIALIISGEIVNYWYDQEIKCIRGNESVL